MTGRGPAARETALAGLDAVLRGSTAPFALLYRPESAGPDALDLLTGPVREAAALADAAPDDGSAVLALVPYRAAAERGMDCTDDGAPLLVMDVRSRSRLPVADFLARVPDTPSRLTDTAFDTEDDAYQDVVRRVVAEKIGAGAGSNFVISRSYTATIEDYTPVRALAVLRRLLEREQGAYWTFLVHTGDRTFVGATPERHITLDAGLATMNPISGTFRYPAGGPTAAAVLDFLGDTKETEELYMVLDEELKMMGDICPEGVRARGPYLKEMAHLAHTEYFIEGRTALPPAEVVRRSMFAPTVVGSPLMNAFRVVDEYERQGRGHYAGVAALIDQDAAGRPRLDSAILIRSAEIDATGRMRLGVGATVVRHSDPRAEAAETRAKTRGLLAALTDSGPGSAPRPRRAEHTASLRDHPEVRRALVRRNAGISGFWFDDDAFREAFRREPLTGRRLLVVDGEDMFTTMLASQLRALGCKVEIRSYRDPFSAEAFDLVVSGPGPGDPQNLADPRIVRMRRVVDELLERRTPFLAVCLSHQLLCTLLGLELTRRERPNQGVQHRIDLFGVARDVGFYNTYAAVAHANKIDSPRSAAQIEVSRDPDTGQVHALRGDHFASIQFHAESVLTRNGPGIIGDLVQALLTGA